MRPKSILIIEDEHALGSALSLLVTRMGHRPTLKASAAAGLEALKKQPFDTAVIDIGLPDRSGLEVLEAIRKSGSTMPVLIITAHATLQHAIDSQKQGATAYMNKPLDMEQLKLQLAALLEAPVHKEGKKQSTKKSIDPVSLIGSAPCLRDVFIGIARACSGNFPVIISGPSGTGKSLAASLIHMHGAQSGGRLHEVVCSSIENWEPQTEWEGGSVILEDLTALGAKAQAALAKWIHSDVSRPFRLIATLSEDPEETVKKGLLREDLHFAFKPCSISMPPLRNRSGDIPALCHFFCGLMQLDGEVPEITSPVMRALQAHDWPGNVRELKHVMEYALSMSQGGPVFLSHLPEAIVVEMSDASSDSQLGSELEIAIQRWLDHELESTTEPSYDRLLQRLESELLKHLMDRYEGKPTRLAEALNMHRGTLRQKLQRMGLQRE